MPTKMVCLICDEEYEGTEKTCPFDQSSLVELQEPWKAGMIVGEKYEILDAITDGGMGRIYKARHTLMNRTVAIKTILPTLITSKAAMKRLMQEASALSILDHPNILRVTDVGIEGGQPYLVMDFIQGTNLDHIVKNGEPLPPSRAVPMFIAAAAGLEHAHQRGVIHRDIKPANIMICQYDGNPDFVKIVDFGIAKLDASELGEAVNLTATGEIFGSPQYMSPEQCGAKPQDVRSDVYSLGCVMYFALTGHAPFTGGSPIECMYQQVHGEAVPFAQILPEVQLPRGLEEVVFKCLNKDPAGRYQTMEELRQALEAVRVGHHVTIAIPLPVGQVTEAIQKNLGSVSEKIGVPPALLAVAIVGVVIMVVLGVSSLHEKTDGKPDEVTYFIPPEPGRKPSTPTAPAMQPVTQTAVDTPSVGTGPQIYAPPEPETPDALWTPPTPPKKSVQTPAPVPAATPAPTHQWTLSDYYTGYMNAGQKALKKGDLYEARSYFKGAHDVAGRFGTNDIRYVDSLQALGMVSYKQGDYQAAKAALDWVVFEKKRRFGDESAQARAAEKDLEAVKRALDR